MLETIFLTCKQCGGESPHDAQYCIECGEALGSATGATTKLATPTCQSCGSENLPDARFCAMCGRSVPNNAEMLQPWPSAVGIPKPRQMPQVAPRPMPIPQPVAQPIAAPPIVVTPPQSRHRHQRHSGRHGMRPSVFVAIIGFAALIMLKAATWPLIMVVLGAVFLVHSAERGRAEQALRTVAMIGAGLLVFNNPRFWPVLLIGFGLMKVLRGRRVF